MNSRPMNSRWISARQTKYAVYATVYVAVIIAIVAIAKIFSPTGTTKSYDATANKRATACLNRRKKS